MPATDGQAERRAGREGWEVLQGRQMKQLRSLGDGALTFPFAGKCTVKSLRLFQCFFVLPLTQTAPVPLAFHSYLKEDSASNWLCVSFSRWHSTDIAESLALCCSCH